MLKHYFKLIWRNLVKDSQFSILNLVGLSTGLACALLIYLWVKDEVSMDKFNKRDSQLFQVMQNAPLADGNVETMPNTPGVLATALANDLPEIEQAVVVAGGDDDTKGVVTINNTSIKVNERYVSNNFFEFFPFKIIEGNKDRPLADRKGILISKDLALKLFHATEGIVGKQVEWNKEGSWSEPGLYAVAGIFENISSHSSLQFDMLFSFDFAVENSKGNNWRSNYTNNYIVLKKGADAKQVNDKVKNFLRAKYTAAYGSANLKYIGTLFLQRYSDRYLYSRYENGVQVGGKIEYVKLFSIIAILILIIACINFMNLATAKSSKRAKELGIKKVMGAPRHTLVIQYIGESVQMTLVALIIAFGLVLLLLPVFNELTGKQLGSDFSFGLILQAIGISFLTGVIAGSYPALYLSGFNPIVVLSGKFKAASGELLIRKGLVVFQFVLSVVFIVSVLVIYQQMKLIHTKNLGYSKANVITFPFDGKNLQVQDVFLSEIRKVPGVLKVSSMSGDLLGNYGGGNGISWEGQAPNQSIEFAGSYVNYDVVETLGMQMVEGRSFSRDFGSDSTKVIFNESAIAAMNLKNPIGKRVSLWGKNKEIIGVVKDFNFESLYKNIKPYFLCYSPESSDNLLVKIKAGMEKPATAALSSLYKKFNPLLTFEYNFMDKSYRKMYATEQRVSVLSNYFAGVAIIISCLGLFGLAAFSAQKRLKEIGIRKVIGASTGNIVTMLSTDFLKLVVLSVFIAFPIGWWVMNQWLNGFAYRISIGPGIFLLACGAILLITLLTIGSQAVKAAVANPVKSLRTE